MNGREPVVIGGEIPPEAEGFVVGVHHRLYHAELRRWRHERGLSQKQLARMCGLGEQTVGKIETLRRYPDAKTADLLAEATGIPCEQLFPGWLKEWIGTTPTSFVTEHAVTETALSAPEIRGHPMLAESMDGALDKADLHEMRVAVLRLVEDLPPRERTVLAHRFGLTGALPLTLGDIAKELNVSRERIRQIESDALRHLRQPKRSKMLSRFLANEDAGPDKRLPVDKAAHVCTSCGVTIHLDREPGYIIDGRAGKFHEECARQIRVEAGGRQLAKLGVHSARTAQSL